MRATVERGDLPALSTSGTQQDKTETAPQALADLRRARGAAGPTVRMFLSDALASSMKSLVKVAEDANGSFCGDVVRGELCSA